MSGCFTARNSVTEVGLVNFWPPQNLGDWNSGGRSLSLILQRQNRIQSCDPLVQCRLFFDKCACFTGIEELSSVESAEKLD
jgi:hypothetical protein